MNLRTLTVLVLACLIWLSGPSPSRAEDTALDAETKARVVDWVCEILEEKYLFPEIGEQMQLELRAKLGAGEYDGIESLDAFCRTLRAQIVAICHDEHFGLRINTDIPPEEDADEAAKRLFRQEKIERDRRENFHFKRVEVLRGNVGYLRFDEFADARWAGDTAVAAMEFLSGCDALIIDLRHNGGGHSTMVQLLLGYLFDDTTHYNTFYIREDDEILQDWTHAWVPGPKLLDQEVYVLVSGRITFSAAEAFAFALQKLKRATIVGETTSGGAHAVKYYYLRDLNLEFKVPYGRGYDPESGEDFEGVGVKPDVEVPEERALDKAHLLALESLLGKADEARRAELDWLCGYQRAIAEPAEIPLETARKYAGTYGPIRVRVEYGRLEILEPGSRVWRPLRGQSQTLFVVEDSDKVRAEFELNDNGEVVAVIGIMQDGRRMRLPKS